MIIVWIRLVATEVVRSGRFCICFECIYCEEFANEVSVRWEIQRLRKQSRCFGWIS